MKLFPQDIMNLSAESHFSRFHNTSYVLYLIILFFVVGIIPALFWVKTDITVQSRGVICSSIESIPITSPVVAKVVQSNLDENKFMSHGDTLVWLNHEKLKERIKHLENLIAENETYLNDIKQMLNFNNPSVKTDLYNARHSQYRQKISELNITVDIREKAYNRALSLLKKKVIPLTEMEEKEFQLNNAEEKKFIFVKQSREEWQRLAKNYKKENKKYRYDIKELHREMEKYVLTAPGTGFISNFNGIKPGSYVSPGQTIATISPSDSIIAEAHVTPDKIGFLREEMPVVFRIDAYNHYQWGVASGRITDISHDIYFQNNKPFFKVRCSVNEPYLTLKNGYEGKIKKGLTTTAHFKITRRSLAQLLFDKTDNWLNPKTMKTNF